MGRYLELARNALDRSRARSEARQNRPGQEAEHRGSRQREPALRNHRDPHCAEQERTLLAGASLQVGDLSLTHSVKELLAPAPAPVRWYMDNPGGLLPAGAVDLARPHDGWPSGAWRDWLLYLAGRCEELNSARATELRLAAIAMIPDWHEVYQERAAIFEYETTPMTPDEHAQAESATTLERLAAVFRDPERRRQAEVGALVDTLRLMKLAETMRVDRGTDNS